VLPALRYYLHVAGTNLSCAVLPALLYYVPYYRHYFIMCGVAGTNFLCAVLLAQIMFRVAGNNLLCAVLPELH
jgi:hypothetical protein